MKLNLNWKALEAGLMAAGPILIQFAPARETWWLGVMFTSLRPILMAIQSPTKAPQRSTKRRRVATSK